MNGSAVLAWRVGRRRCRIAGEAPARDQDESARDSNYRPTYGR